MNFWAQDRGLIFAPEKCFQIRFVKRRRRTDSLPVFLRGQQLNKKSAILYLGVWLDETTSSNTQVASAAGKVRTRLDWIRRLTGPTWGMLPEAVEKLVSRVIEPAAYFGAEVWQRAAYNERTAGHLEKVMRQACLLLAGTFRTTSYPSAYSLAGVRPPTQQIVQQALYFDARRRHRKPATPMSLQARIERSAGQCYRRIAWSRWQRATPRRPLEIPPQRIHPWSPISPSQLELLSGPASIPASERPDWILSVSTQQDRVRHRLGTSWGLFQGDNRQGESWWDPDWASEEISTLVGLYKGLCTLKERLTSTAPIRRQSLVVIVDSNRIQKAALSWTNVSETGIQIQQELLDWAMDGHSTYWATQKWKPGLSYALSEWRRSNTITEDCSGGPKGIPPDRSWIKHRIAQFLNQEAAKDIKQRNTSFHLTAHLTNFRRGHFPGKYLERPQASRLSQFAANHFPSKQYLFRFGALAESPECSCGAALEDRDHLLLECPLFHEARRKLQRQIPGTLSTACIFQFPKEMSEFVEDISAKWRQEGRIWCNS